MSGAEIEVALKDGSGGRVAWVTVHNPARLNILDSNGFDALAGAFEGLAEDGELRLAVLTGDGQKAFIGGADISEMINWPTWDWTSTTPTCTLTNSVAGSGKGWR